MWGTRKQYRATLGSTLSNACGSLYLLGYITFFVVVPFLSLSLFLVLVPFSCCSAPTHYRFSSRVFLRGLRMFIWESESGRLVRAIEADSNIVNCIAPHPSLPLVATRYVVVVEWKTPTRFMTVTARNEVKIRQTVYTPI